MKRKKSPPMKMKTIVLTIIGIALILVLYSFLFNIPGVVVSCKDGRVLGFGHYSMPPMTMVAPPTGCAAEMIVKSSSGQIICNSTDKTESTERILVLCKGLKEYKGKSISIQFMTNSTEFGLKAGNEDKVYGE